MTSELVTPSAEQCFIISFLVEEKEKPTEILPVKCTAWGRVTVICVYEYTLSFKTVKKSPTFRMLMFVQLYAAWNGITRDIYHQKSQKTQMLAGAPPSTNDEAINYCTERSFALVLGCEHNSHHFMWKSSDVCPRCRALLKYLGTLNLVTKSRIGSCLSH
jgi:hypothetical protein